jgi:hypothetical protein
MSFKENYYTAIVICQHQETGITHSSGKKYRDIPKHKTDPFLKFVRGKFNSAVYVNFYHASDKTFSHRENL